MRSALLFAAAILLPAQQQPQEWLQYGGDSGGSKYSKLAQIHRGNVAGLKLAWEWKTGEAPNEQYKTTPGTFQATPLMIDGALYFSTPYNRVIAMEAQSGKILWEYDPKAWEWGQVGEIAWRVPFGDSAALRAHPALMGVALPEKLGAVGVAGALATRGGLVFIGGGDTAFHAVDMRNGTDLWTWPTKRRTTGTPMTYQTKSGKQFVLIATGSGADAALMAFALREDVK